MQEAMPIQLSLKIFRDDDGMFGRKFDEFGQHARKARLAFDELAVAVGPRARVCVFTAK